MRGVVALAIRSGIPVETWLNGDQRDIFTALELYEELDEESRRKK